MPIPKKSPAFLPTEVKNPRLLDLVAGLLVYEEGDLILKIAHFHQTIDTTPFTTGWQTHPHAEFTLVRGGEMDYSGEGFTSRRKRGEMCFIPPGTVHCRTTRKTPSVLDSFHLLFESRTEEGRKRLADLRSHFLKMKFRIATPVAVVERFEAIDREIRERHLFCERRIVSLMTDIVILTLRPDLEKIFSKTAAPAKAPLKTSSQRENRLLQIGKDYIEANLSRPIHTNAVADAMGITERYVNKIFSGFENKSCGQYIQEKRLLKAYAIFDLHPNRKILEVSREVGIEDPLYFSKLFVRRFGMSPKEIRDRRYAKKPV